MLILLRKIRNQLIKKNEVTTYLLYGVGEILLVVVGILVALQIDGWSKVIKDDKEEKEILSKLHEEFLFNQNQLKDNIILYEKSLKNKLIILELAGASKEKLQQTNIDSLLNSSFPLGTYKPSNNVFQDVIQSGRLQLLKNIELRQALFRVGQLNELIEDRDFKLDKWTFEMEIPILIKYASFKQIDTYTKYPWGGESNLNTKYYEMFNLLEFENIIDNAAYQITKMKEALENAEKEVNIILDLTANNQ